MKAVGFLKSLEIERTNSLFEVDLPDPIVGAEDVLVRVEAISVNPADAKRRIRTAVDKDHEAPMVLGYDAVGVIVETGSNVAGFSIGDRIWYAGDANRQGSYAELQAVDHRIVSLAPKTVEPAAAASLPLVSLTAWEMLFDRLQVPTHESSGTLLVIAGAGGVGSITLQLARQLTGLHLIATASRPESKSWCLKMGAHEVIGHDDLVSNFRAAGHQYADYITQYADTAGHWDAMCDLIAPQGRIGTIVETSKNLNISALQEKSAALMWELMFTRSLFATRDMGRQGFILSRVAKMIDDQTLKTTEQTVLHGLSAVTLKKAHTLIESGQTIGKIVVDFS